MRSKKNRKIDENSNWNPTFSIFRFSDFRDFLRFSKIFQKILDFSSKIFFQSHLKKILLDEFSKFWYLEKVEIISFHEHLKSFNSSDSSPSYRTSKIINFHVFSYYMTKKDPFFLQNCHLGRDSRLQPQNPTHLLQKLRNGFQIQKNTIN